MRKHCSNVCKLRPCLATEPTNLARMCTITTTALQRQYSQTEFIFCITLVVLKPQLYIHIRRQENESKLEVGIFMAVIPYFFKCCSRGNVFIYLNTVIINSENKMPSDLMIVFFHKIEICLALHVPGK